jgi:hypothetical protein
MGIGEHSSSSAPMHMNVKSLLEVADDKDDDTEDDPAPRETMVKRSRSLAELTQWIEQEGRLSRARGFLASSRFTFGHGVRGDPATYPL